MLSSWPKPCATPRSPAAKPSWLAAWKNACTPPPPRRSPASSANAQNDVSHGISEGRNRKPAIIKLFRLRLGELKPLALAAREVARLRQFRVLVHRSIHPYVNAF